MAHKKIPFIIQKLEPGDIDLAKGLFSFFQTDDGISDLLPVNIEIRR